MGELAMQTAGDCACRRAAKLAWRIEWNACAGRCRRQPRSQLDQEVSIRVVMMLCVRLTGRIKHQVAIASLDRTAVEPLGVRAADHEAEMRVLVDMERQTLPILVLRFAQKKGGRGGRRRGASEVSPGRKMEQLFLRR